MPKFPKSDPKVGFQITVGKKVIATRVVMMLPNGAIIRTPPLTHTRWN
jgi:hypothetical protein